MLRGGTKSMRQRVREYDLSEVRESEMREPEYDEDLLGAMNYERIVR